MKQIWLLVYLIPVLVFSQSATENRDTWNDVSLPDSTRMLALNALARSYLYTNPDSAELLSEIGLEEARRLENPSLQIAFLMKLGSLHYQHGKIPKAALTFQKAIQVGEQSKDQRSIAQNLSNMAVMYRLLGKKEEAMKANRRALAIAQKMNDEVQVATCLNNIGIIYGANKKYDEALEVYQRALEIRNRRNEPAAVVNILGNLGVIYEAQGLQEKTDSIYDAILGLMDHVEDPTVRIAFLNAKANVMIVRGKNREAEPLAKEALKRARIIDDEFAMAKALGQLAAGYQNRRMNKTAVIYGDSTLALAQRTGSIEEQRNILKVLSQAHEGLGNYALALDYLEQSRELTDSMVNSKNNRAILQMQYAMEFDQKATADSVLNAEAQKVKDAELTAIVEKNKTQQQRFWILGIGIGLALLFGLLLWRRFHVTNKQQKVIQSQTEEIEQQRVVLEIKNDELLSSVEYARRLQEAILPSSTFINKHFSDSFCLYLPQELVSGDFYWMEVVGPNIFFACGGGAQNGVPGAMFSVMSANALSKAVTESKLVDPGEILNEVSTNISERLISAEGQTSSGPSVSLLALNMESMTMQWAGANAPLWIIPKHESSFTEYSGTDEKIAEGTQGSGFKSQPISINKDDKLYLFSDGYKTIFNNEQMRLTLLAGKDKSMPDQNTALERELKRHLNKKQLADDITVIGLKI